MGFKMVGYILRFGIFLTCLQFSVLLSQEAAFHMTLINQSQQQVATITNTSQHPDITIFNARDRQAIAHASTGSYSAQLETAISTHQNPLPRMYAGEQFKTALDISTSDLAVDLKQSYDLAKSRVVKDVLARELLSVTKISESY